jgi:peptidoglycan hydrolase CwlO-like protein
MNLALEKKKLEIKKVETAMLEMEYKVLERLADIERLKENINNQQKTIDRLKEEIEVTGE